MPYLTPAQFLTYYDQRKVLEALSDTDEPVLIADYPTNEIILQLIANSCGMLDSALQTGNKYTRQAVEDICAAAASSDAAKKRAGPIQAVIAHLTWGQLQSRRGFGAADLSILAPMYEKAMDFIDKLTEGTAVLDLDANIQAGVPTSATIGTQAAPLWANNGMFPCNSGNYYNRRYY
jgi:hypothetical protein